MEKYFFPYYLKIWPMGWWCKICKSLSATKGDLLEHYRLQHVTFGRGQTQPCLHDGCPCTFKSHGALRTHLSRYHAAEESPRLGIITTLKSLVCSARCPTEKDYFLHIGNHLKNHQTVFCVFERCDFHTNIYNDFLKHKYRKHKSYSLSGFKKDIFESHRSQTVDHAYAPETDDGQDPSLDCDPKSESYNICHIYTSTSTEARKHLQCISEVH